MAGIAKASYGKIGVLMGGPSTEREISFKSGHAVHDSLLGLGLDAVAIDITTDSVEENLRLLKDSRIDSAFIALHGIFGEDGTIQAILDELKIPYTGSGVTASRLAMDKAASREIFEQNGLKVPRYMVLNSEPCCARSVTDKGFSLPLVVKPATNGSSIGLSIVDNAAGLPGAIEAAFKFDQRVLIEEYIPGREITVGILNEKPLPVVEVVPKKRFFDFEAKYQAGMTDYIVPARLEPELASRAQQAALAAHKLLGCRGCSRVDIILDGTEQAVVLEVNTIPGMTQTSLLPKAAKVAGMDFTSLCLVLLDLAYEKAKNQPSL